MLGNSRAMFIADGLTYDNPHYSNDRYAINTYAFLVDRGAYYVLLHTGGATMGSEYLYHISSDSGITLLVETRLNDFSVIDDYVYYLGMHNVGGADTLYRIHLPTSLCGENGVQSIGQEGYIYGYLRHNPLSRYSTSNFGYLVEGGFMITAGFTFDVENESAVGQGNYRIDLNTMEHVKISDLER